MSVFPMTLTENLELVKSSDVEGRILNGSGRVGEARTCVRTAGQSAELPQGGPSLLLKMWLLLKT